MTPNEIIVPSLCRRAVQKVKSSPTTCLASSQNKAEITTNAQGPTDTALDPRVCDDPRFFQMPPTFAGITKSVPYDESRLIKCRPTRRASPVSLDDGALMIEEWRFNVTFSRCYIVSSSRAT